MAVVRKMVSFWIFIIPDLALMYLGLYLSLVVRYGSKASTDVNLISVHFSAFTFVHLVWLLVLFAHNLFDSSSFRRYSTLLFSLISAMAINLLAAIVYFYYQPELILTPRRFLLIDVSICFSLLLLWHGLIKYFYGNKIREDVYLFALGDELANLEAEIASRGYLGLKIRGHLDASNFNSAQIPAGSSIIITEQISSKPEALEHFFELRKKGVNFYNSNDFYEILLRRVYLEHSNQLWFLENIDYKEKRPYKLLKRSFDIVFGIILMLAFLVTLPFITLAIKIFSRGPVFFIQTRVGKLGKMFQVYKYRTMSVGQNSGWTLPNDPRITNIGQMLRRTRLDELPQFINLFSGNMSMVGPRPEQVEIAEQMRAKIAFYDERHLIKPGLTGWAQLNVYASDLQQTKLKLQYDLYYVKNRSLLFDLEIILKTLYYVIVGYRN